MHPDSWPLRASASSRRPTLVSRSRVGDRGGTGGLGHTRNDEISAGFDVAARRKACEGTVVQRGVTDGNTRFESNFHKTVDDADVASTLAGRTDDRLEVVQKSIREVDTVELDPGSQG